MGKGNVGGDQLAAARLAAQGQVGRGSQPNGNNNVRGIGGFDFNGHIAILDGQRQAAVQSYQKNLRHRYN